MRFALDSNILIYAIGLEDSAKRERAIKLIEAIPARDLIIPLQVIGEATRWVYTKGKRSKSFAREQASRWIETYTTQETSRPILEAALDLIAKHQFQIWDAIILSAASAAGSGYLLSEDLQHGFRWRGVKIINPFMDPTPAEIRAILKAV